MSENFVFGLSADEVNASAAVMTFFIASAAVVVAWRQLRSGRQEARNSLAKTLYKDYLALAMSNPRFSMASYPINDPKFIELRKNQEDYDAYEFYVAYLLYAVEEIVELTSGGDEWLGWRETIMSQLGYHALYLQSQDFPRSHWSRDVLCLVDEALKKYSHLCAPIVP